MAAYLAENDFVLWGLLLLICAISLSLEKFESVRKIGGPILVLTITALLSNVGLIPKSSSVYATVWHYGVPIAVVLLLFDANLKRIIFESGPTLLAFCLGGIGTVIGVLLGLVLLPLGDFEPQLAAVFSATYIGGSLNFAAVSESIGFTDPSMLTASIAADTVVGTLYLALLIALPASKFVTKKLGLEAYRSDTDTIVDESPAFQFSMTGAMAALGLAFLIVGASNYLASLFGVPNFRLVIATVIVVISASLFRGKLSTLREAFPLGMIIMYLFFCMIGAGVDVMVMLENGLVIAAFCTIILASHFCFLCCTARFFKLSLPETIVASNACVLGPPTAAAMASANGWKALITPAILCGTFGYAIANIVGMLFFSGLT